MFVQVKDYFAVLFALSKKSFLGKYLKSDTVKLNIYCQRMNKKRGVFCHCTASGMYSPLIKVSMTLRHGKHAIRRFSNNDNNVRPHPIVNGSEKTAAYPAECGLRHQF